MLGGIDTDDGKAFTTDFLDTWADHSIRFLQRLPARLGFVLHTAGSSDVVRHAGFSVIGESKGADLNFPPQQSKLTILLEEVFWGSKRHTWVCRILARANKHNASVATSVEEASVIQV